MSIKIIINSEELAKQFKEFVAEAKADIEKGVSLLAIQAYEKGKDLASEELKSTRDLFLDNFKRPDEVAPGVHIIWLLEDAAFIEDGLPANFDMKEGLLKSDKAKTSKSGFKYLAVPFSHTKAPTRSTPSAQAVIKRIRENLKKEKVPFKTLELNADGSPRIGKLHSFDWGGNIPGKGNTRDLERVSIYQTVTATGNVRRDIMTFRTVSGNPASADKWKHPGMEGKKFLDRAADWAMQEWENQILPSIIKKWDMQ